MNTLALAAPRVSLVRCYALEAKHEFLRVLRAPSFAVPTLIFPPMFYLLFAVLFGNRGGDFHANIYLLATYGVFGLIASIALLVHVCLIFGLMSVLGATMTLPGIAGIVLTIGTAVDSNVLIYERMREEAHQGRSLVSALEAGFQRAFATIIDSNVTMLIAAVALFSLGSGPVRGFAVVFILGILTTVITAVTLTRMLIALWYRWARPKTLPF
jgi:preprotein translocase subunit SecD